MQAQHSWILSGFFFGWLKLWLTILWSHLWTVLFLSTIKGSLTVCLLIADCCVSLTAAILSQSGKWQPCALYCFPIFQHAAEQCLDRLASLCICVGFYKLFVFICRPDALYVLPENVLFFLWSKLFNDLKLQRMNAFVYCVGPPTQFAVSIHWIINNLSIMTKVCMSELEK